MTDKPVATVHLGQFTDEHANDIAAELEKAGIVWWYKQPAFFSRLWEQGTRLFVDKARLEEAKLIAGKVLARSAGSEGPDA